MSICRKNLQYTKELHKRYYDEHVKPKSYALGDKVSFHNKYIKTKQNRKLEFKFFEPLRVLHPVKKQAYNLKLPKRWRFHDVFHIFRLE